MLSFRAVLKVGRKNACICQQTFLLCRRFMVYVCKWTDLGRNPMNLLSFCLCPDAFAIFSPYASAGQPEKKNAPVRGSAHNNICDEAKHIDISPERSKHFPEMLTSFAWNVCFFWENAPCSTRNAPFFGWKNLRLAPKSLLLHSISSCPEEEGVSKCKANCSF